MAPTTDLMDPANHQRRARDSASPPQRESPGRESEASQSNSPGGLKLRTSVPQPTDTPQRFDRRLILLRRCASIELNILLGRRGYPDVDDVYPLIVSREPVPDEC
jgi:hypothetical protein